MKKTLLFLLPVVLIMSCINTEYISVDDKLEGVKIQPKEALEIAKPYLDEKATYLWRDSSKLKTHIVKKGRYYYIMKTDYPAKSVYYYLEPAVRVNSKNGSIKFIKDK